MRDVSNCDLHRFPYQNRSEHTDRHVCVLMLIVFDLPTFFSSHDRPVNGSAESRNKLTLPIIAHRLHAMCMLSHRADPLETHMTSMNLLRVKIDLKCLERDGALEYR